MLPIGHVALSSFIGICVGVYFKSFGCAVAAFIPGVFIDLDHLIDYYANHSFTWKAKTIYECCRNIKFKRVYLLLHSYELIALLWLAIYFYKLSNMWIAVAIGLTQHMIFDQITNPIRGLGYFLTYRVLKGFDKNLIIR